MLYDYSLTERMTIHATFDGCLLDLVLYLVLIHGLTATEEPWERGERLVATLAERASHGTEDSVL